MNPPDFENRPQKQTDQDEIQIGYCFSGDLCPNGKDCQANDHHQNRPQQTPTDQDEIQQDYCFCRNDDFVNSQERANLMNMDIENHYYTNLFRLEQDMNFMNLGQQSYGETFMSNLENLESSDVHMNVLRSSFDQKTGNLVDFEKQKFVLMSPGTPTLESNVMNFKEMIRDSLQPNCYWCRETGEDKIGSSVWDSLTIG